ncbi:arginine deiminase family protein [Pontibacillus salicampi]|uniref:Arginine deiminase family protein n=1 Tax=Pontibacillus salicampi TaxID=1449801 RepID=A0ABV6LKK8_9BACI
MDSIHASCFSEHEPLHSVVLCPPSDLDVTDMKIATQVQWNGPVDQSKARECHENLVGALQQEGVRTIMYDEFLSDKDLHLSKQLINRVFVRDLACVFGESVLPGEAGTSMRKPEYVQFHLLLSHWLPDAFQINENNDIKALEFGDLLILNKDAIFINVGMRTSISSLERVKEAIFQAGFSEIGIIDLPRSASTLHLDMNCNVAGSDVVVAKQFLKYFPVQVITESSSSFSMVDAFLFRHGFDIHWLQSYKTIPDINFLNVNPETLLVSKQCNKNSLKEHPSLQKKNIISIDVTELEKGGGGIRCMTLPLHRG